MAKEITFLGLGIFWFFLMVTFVVSNVWAWGCLVGMAILAVGWYCWEEED